MMPIGPLMIEHRLIERMIRVMKGELERIEERQSVEPRFIEVAVDFIRTYADRCHHGKEEDILFRDLKKKELTDEHRQTMADLELEHRWGRETVGRLGQCTRELWARRPGIARNYQGLHDSTGGILSKTYRERGQAFFFAGDDLSYRRGKKRLCFRKNMTLTGPFFMSNTERGSSSSNVKSCRQTDEILSMAGDFQPTCFGNCRKP